MSLVIEDGTTVDGANSFADLAEADGWLVPRSLWPTTPEAPVAPEAPVIPEVSAMPEVPATFLAGTGSGLEIPDPAVIIAKKEAALLRAVDWLNTLQWKGRKYSYAQRLCWPRYDVVADGESVPFDDVPPQVATAQIEMAALIFGGLDPLAPAESGVAAVSESSSEGLDVLSEGKSRAVTYRAGAEGEKSYAAVTGILAPFLRVVPGKSGGSGFVEVGRG